MKRTGRVMKVWTFLLLICCMFSVGTAFADADETVILSEAMTAETYSATNGIELPYRLYVPENYDETKAYAFLLFLHGAGNRGDDNLSQISVNTGLIERIIGGETVTYEGEEIDTSQEFIIVAPQCGKDCQWVDTPWDKEPDPSYDVEKIAESAYMTALNELLDILFETYSMDETRQYITGLSMGGFGTWDLLMRQPERWAAAIPMGGGADLSKTECVSDIPIWTFHQILDSVVLSEGTQNMVSAVVKAGGDIKFTPYFDLQHNAWTKGYAEKDLLQWLYSHKNTKQTQDKIKIACVGDSITYGAGLTDRENESFPSVLQNELADKAVVGNFGVAATSALKTAKAPYTETEEYKQSLAFGADVLFIMLGTNDIKTENWQEGSERFEQDYADLINSYKAVNPNVKIFVGIPPRIFKDNVYGERSTMVLEQEAFPKIRAVAETVGADVVDVFGATVEAEEHFPDYLHPDAEGHQLIEQLLMKTFSETVFAAKQEKITPITGASSWAEKELALAYATGIMPGCVQGQWQETMTREEFCEGVTAMIPEEIHGERTAHFTDTDNEAVERAYALGVVNGVSEERFLPAQAITREETGVMLQRVYRLLEPNAQYASETAFADENEISVWAQESLAFMNGARVITEDAAGYIYPQENISCEQGVIMIWRTFISANSYAALNNK